MNYFEVHNNDYIVGVGKGRYGIEINEDRYNAVINSLSLKPPATETTDYRLKTDLTWEQYDIPPKPIDPEIEDSEALDIILGGAT